MVGRVLRYYVKEERRIPVLEVLVRFLNDETTKTEVHTPAIEPFAQPAAAHATAPPHPSLPKVCLLTPALHAPNPNPNPSPNSNPNPSPNPNSTSKVTATNA